MLENAFRDKKKLRNILGPLSAIQAHWKTLANLQNFLRKSARVICTVPSLPGEKSL